uniref:Uncharacterized protein n=1 Tax=Anguilla anguilla TaxID=7936 RepID=A0A0E9RFS5_ANGAN
MEAVSDININHCWLGKLH